MIDVRNQYEKTKTWLKANQVSSDNSVFNDHRHAHYCLHFLQANFQTNNQLGNDIS